MDSEFSYQDSQNKSTTQMRKRPQLSSLIDDSFPRDAKRERINEGSSEVEKKHYEAYAKFIENSNDPFNLVDYLNDSEFGSVTKQVEETIAPTVSCRNLDVYNGALKGKNVTTEQGKSITCPIVIIDDDDLGDSSTAISTDESRKPLESSPPVKEYADSEVNPSDSLQENDIVDVEAEAETRKDKGEYDCVEDDEMGIEEEEEEEFEIPNDEGLADIWSEMHIAIEDAKSTEVEVNDEEVPEDGDDCEHSFILKDDIGQVCRICGLIDKPIDTIIEYQFPKATKKSNSYRYEGSTSRKIDVDEGDFDGSKFGGHEFAVKEIYAHPRHRKQMKPHQVEGFKFLVSNLVCDKPGGCIMAHAPGSGKTFMIISFLQSFMANYTDARPLIILPRGILATWKKEFIRWQVEDLPLYDFYSVKAENRTQQLEVLKLWAQNRSILFLGYKQFSSIISDIDTNKVSSTCQELLLTCASILILDEGHTPRNKETDILSSLEKVQTPRKVILSGTLYQNHVKEVFNILNLVRPKFLKMDIPKEIKKRILSRATIPGKMKKPDFFDVVEHTLLKDESLNRKVMVIKDLREMTSKVLHYYRGDSLDELPGLVDFTVLLKLSHSQAQETSELKKINRKFKISSEGGALYVHPILRTLSKNPEAKDRVDELRIDPLLDNLEIGEGVKAKFFLNLLQLCESTGEKLLVFSQYLLPLKFLERLTIKMKGYSNGKEIFMITGNSDADIREASMEQFNNSPDARVFFGSIKACGEGISLVGASRIIILDVHLNPSVTRQAIGRAFRPGQVRKVYVYRLVASESPEEEDHETCFKKETIAKLWFEWNEYSGNQEFVMESVDMDNCGDSFLETSRLKEDVAALYRR